MTTCEESVPGEIQMSHKAKEVVAMSATMTITLRVPPDVRERLKQAALEERTTMSALAVAAIRAYLDGDGPSGGDVLLARVVAEEFGQDSLATPVELAVALEWARTAVGAGAASVSAGKALLDLHAKITGEETDPDLMDLHIPE